MNFLDLYKKIAQLDEQAPPLAPTADDMPASECGNMSANGQPLMGEQGLANPAALAQQQMAAMQAKMPNLDPATMMKNQQARMAAMKAKQPVSSQGTWTQQGVPAGQAAPVAAPTAKATATTAPADTEQDWEESMEECGGMTSISSQPPKQSDSVTMNVSMNGSGAGGIRDLMNILKNIDGNGADSDVNKLFGNDKEVSFDEEAVNSPNEVTLDISAVTPAGDDLHSHAGNEVEKVNGGGNPYSNVDESLVSKLQAMYEAVKEKEPEGLHSKKRFETDSQRVARLAKEKRQAEKKERMKNDFNAEMERE